MTPDLTPKQARFVAPKTYPIGLAIFVSVLMGIFIGWALALIQAV